MSYNQAPISTPISVSNDTNVPIEFAINERFQYPLVSRASDYVMAVTRIKVPSQLIETFVVDDEYIPDYYLSIKHPNYSRKKVYWPDSRGIMLLHETDEYVGVQKHYSPTDVLNTLNSMLFNAYHQALKDSVSFLSWTKTDFEFDGSTYTYNSGNHEFTFPGSTKLAYVELIIDNFTASKTGGGAFNDHITIAIHAPGGKFYRVLIIDNPDTFGWDNSNEDVVLLISDRGFRQMTNGVDTGGITDGVILYQPSETSIAFADSVTDPNGNWYITVISGANTHFEGSMSFKLRPFYNQTFRPTDSMSFSLSGNKVQLTYQETFNSANWRLMLSPKINTLVNFQPLTFLESGMYVLSYPFFPSSSATHTLVQSRSSISSMTNLNRIGVYSYRLPLAESEIINNHVSSQIVTDFIILETSDETAGDYVYVQESVPWRYYELQSNDPIIELLLEVRAIYNNQGERRVYINPGDNASMRISFFPRSPQ